MGAGLRQRGCGKGTVGVGAVSARGGGGDDSALSLWRSSQMMSRSCTIKVLEPQMPPSALSRNLFSLAGSLPHTCDAVRRLSTIHDISNGFHRTDFIQPATESVLFRNNHAILKKAPQSIHSGEATTFYSVPDYGKNTKKCKRGQKDNPRQFVQRKASSTTFITGLSSDFSKCANHTTNDQLFGNCGVGAKKVPDRRIPGA